MTQGETKRTKDTLYMTVQSQVLTIVHIHKSVLYVISEKHLSQSYSKAKNLNHSKLNVSCKKHPRKTCIFSVTTDGSNLYLSLCKVLFWANRNFFSHLYFVDKYRIPATYIDLVWAVLRQRHTQPSCTIMYLLISFYQLIS